MLSLRRVPIYTYQKFQEMLAETKREGDRACALILTANLDNRLREVLVAHFIQMSSALQKSLFEGTGALSSFSSRIRVTYSCGLLSEDEFHDLNIIRKVRNCFAHEEHGWSFATSEICALCSSLKMPTFIQSEYPELASNLETSRSTFQIAAASLTLLLMSRAKEAIGNKRTAHLPTSILPRRKP